MNRIITSIITLITAATSFAATSQDSPLWIRKNCISPDGTKIAFTYKGDIYYVAAEGGRAVQLTTNPAYDSDPIWTPDGKNLVFSSYREGSKDIYIMDAQGGAAKRITTWTGNETPLAIYGDEIWFSSEIQQDADYGDFPGKPQVYAVKTNGGRPRQVTSLPAGSLSINSRGMVLYEDIKGYEDAFRKHHTSPVTRDI